MLRWNIFLMATNAFSMSRSRGASNWEQSGSPGLPPPGDSQPSSILRAALAWRTRAGTPSPCLPAGPADDRQDTNGSLIAFLAQPWGRC